jgi:hypothetical protein
MYSALKNVAVTLPRPDPTVIRSTLLHPAGLRGRDHVDDGDVLAFLRALVLDAACAVACDVAARIVPQQVADRLDAEHLVEGVSGLRADDHVEPVTQPDHYSTPINSTSPRCPVR